MNKKFVIGMTLGMLLIVSGLIVTEAQANDSYLVYGIVLKNDGNPNDGATVTITNAAHPTEKITTTTFTDTFGSAGSFQANLGNLLSAWERGDNITVTATSGSWTGSRTFTIPIAGTMYEIANISMNKTTGGGGKERGAGILGTSFGGLGSILIVVLMGIVIGVLWFIFAGTRDRKREYRSYKPKKVKKERWKL